MDPLFPRGLFRGCAFSPANIGHHMVSIIPRKNEAGGAVRGVDVGRSTVARLRLRSQSVAWLTNRVVQAL